MRRALLAGVLILATGCAGGGDDDAAGTSTGPTTAPTTSAATTTSPAADRIILRLYFVRDERMGVATRAVDPTQAVAGAALGELVRGPDATERAAGLSSAVPVGTSVNGVSITAGVATVDFSREFEAGGGSSSMQLRVAQVVHTLTQFPTVQRVAFRIDGRAVDAIGGEGVVVSPPVDRTDFEDHAPAILVESVGPGDRVASPLRVAGTANTFEATLNIRVVAGDGSVLYDDFATATSGTGTRGTFDETIEVDGSGAATLVAYERSAADGSEIHVVRIPIEIGR